MGSRLVSLHCLIEEDHRKALEVRARKEKKSVGKILRDLLDEWIETKREAINAHQEKS